MTIDEARKIFGDSANEMSDEEIDMVIDKLDSLARAFIQSYMRGDIKLPTDFQKEIISPKIK